MMVKLTSISDIVVGTFLSFLQQAEAGTLPHDQVPRGARLKFSWTLWEQSMVGRSMIARPVCTSCMHVLYQQTGSWTGSTRWIPSHEPKLENDNFKRFLH